nr:MAG TPA: hypothetical protein [Caudoviricetes sp.]
MVICIRTIRLIVRIILVRPIVQLCLGVCFARHFAFCHSFTSFERIKKSTQPLRCADKIC